MPARISSSETASTEPPVRRASSTAYGPSAGLPIASDLAIVSGLTGRQTSVPAGERLRDRRAALGLRAVHRRDRAADEPGVDELLEAARDLREQRARGDRRDDAVGELPAELLGRLVRERLGALGVVRAHVDVDERPALALARDLGAEPVDGVVVAAHADDLRAVGAGGEDLLRLEVGGDEDVGGQPGVRGVGRDGAGEVAGRRAGDGVEAELDRARERDRDDAVLERVRRVGRLVLDPELAEAEPLGQAIGAHERRQAGRQRRARRRARAAGSRRSARACAGPPGCGA